MADFAMRVFSKSFINEVSGGPLKFEMQFGAKQWQNLDLNQAGAVWNSLSIGMYPM